MRLRLTEAWWKSMRDIRFVSWKQKRNKKRSVRISGRLRLSINIVVCGRTQFAPTFIIRKIAICRGRRLDVPLIYGFFYSLKRPDFRTLLYVGKHYKKQQTSLTPSQKVNEVRYSYNAERTLYTLSITAGTNFAVP